MKYAKLFKDQYAFLREWGFVFSTDPYNSERPCYKNRYGEIILWVKSGTSETELYLQMNGRKITFDLAAEYEYIFKRKPTLLPKHEIFRRVFTYHAENYGKFLELCIIKDDYAFLEENSPAPTESFTADRNPLAVQYKKYISYGIAISYFLAIILMIIPTRITNAALGLIMFILLLAGNALTCILTKEMQKMAKIIFISYPIVMIFPTMAFSRRVDLAICIALSLISLSYVIYHIILYVKKKEDKSALGFSLLTYIEPFLILLIESFALNRDLHFIDYGRFTPLFIVGAVVSLIVTAVFVRKTEVLENIRKGNSKDQNIGKLLAAFLLSLTIFLLTPYFMLQNINYTFDDSEGEVVSYTVIEKESRHAGRSGRNYYLHIIKDGKQESISVSSAAYNKFDIGDKISFEIHSGALEMEYYEYVE